MFSWWNSLDAVSRISSVSNFLIAALGIWVFVIGRRENQLETKEETEANRTRDTEIASAKERASKADERASNNERIAAEFNERAAKAEESGKQLDLAKAEVQRQLEETRKLTAEANARAETEARKRVELEKQIADTTKSASESAARLQDRRITAEQRDLILMRLKGVPLAHVVIEYVPSDTEAAQFASDIIDLLRKAGANVEPREGAVFFGGAPDVGLSIIVSAIGNRSPSGSRILQEALEEAKVQAVWLPGGGEMIRIRVGKKL